MFEKPTNGERREISPLTVPIFNVGQIPELDESWEQMPSFVGDAYNNEGHHYGDSDATRDFALRVVAAYYKTTPEKALEFYWIYVIPGGPNGSGRIYAGRKG